MFLFNSLPNDNILGLFELKALAYDKINVTKKLKFVMERVENFVGKGRNAGYQHFLLFPQCFQKFSYICGKELTHYQTTNFTLFQTERVCR